MMLGLRARIARIVATSFHRAAIIVGGFGLLTMLPGCIAGEPIELGINIPSNYRAASKAPPGPPPPLDWWRSFGSGELTRLVEEAHRANFDIAAAIARIIEADAQAKIAGAALLPTVDVNDVSVT